MNDEVTLSKLLAVRKDLEGELAKNSDPAFQKSIKDFINAMDKDVLDGFEKDGNKEGIELYKKMINFGNHNE